ncbi:30S ribosomal protein S27ae [archaeon]|nr:30S ribosomal protein S27ae [archaeon]|tara:strand:+ start:1066 stop:1296 length:231 start_codon:yes stop_codon:yes gene_type:complete
MAKDEKGKKELKNHVPSKLWEKYSVSDGKLDRKPTCPRCGPGYFLAQHKDRTYCGKCHYVEMKSSESNKEASKENK